MITGIPGKTGVVYTLDQVGTVYAISAETGEITWKYEQRAATMSLVATGGGLVFGGDVNGRFHAFDHETGDVLWEINLGSSVSGFPITYAVDGRQYVAVSTGTPRFINLTPELRPSLATTSSCSRCPEYPAESMALTVGTRHGHYLVTTLLGEGGMDI